jgi:hypothetical protein
MNQIELPFMAKQSAKAAVQESSYSPLGSVWDGDDSELLENMLEFYPRKRPKLILDATINGGRFWRGSKRPILGLDIEIIHRPDVVADNTAMPFRNDSLDAVVYDRPHIPNQGKDNEKDLTCGSAWCCDRQREPVHFHSHVPAVRQ